MAATTNLTFNLLDTPRTFSAGKSFNIDLGDVTEEFAYTEEALNGEDIELRANEVSDQDLRVSLKKALTAYLTAAGGGESSTAQPYVYCDILAVFKKTVVFYHNNGLWQMTYSLANEGTGEVELKGEPKEVRSVTKYVAAEEVVEDTDIEIVSDEPDEVFASETESNTILSKIKQLLGLTSNPNTSHTSEVEQRSSENNEDEVIEPTTNASEETKTPEESNQMADTKVNTERAEAIKQLVANSRGKYDESDTEWLAKLDDKAFGRVAQFANESIADLVKAEEERKAAEAKAEVEDEVVETKSEAATEIKEPEATPATVVAAAKPKTAEEFIATLDAPKEIVRMFERAVEQDKSARTNYIKSIRANQSNKFTEKQLVAMDTDTLEAMAALATPDKDFSGAGDHTAKRPVRSNESDESKVIPMPALSFGGKKLQNAVK